MRQTGYDKTNAAFKSERDLFAFDVLNVAKTENELANFGATRTGRTPRSSICICPTRVIDTAYQQILAHGDLRKRLQTMQRARIASFTGYDPVHSYDMTVVPPPSPSRASPSTSRARSSSTSRIIWGRSTRGR